MTDVTDQHAPTPEFRAALKQELRRAYRADRQFGSPRSPLTRRLGLVIGVAAGVVIALTIGLVLGASASYASAEMIDARREAAATRVATKRQFAAMRLDLARANYEAVRREVEAGTATPAALRLARAEVDSMEADAARVEVDLRAGGAPAPEPPSGLSRLSVPVRNALTALTCVAATATAQTTPAQKGIPVIEVTPAVAKTTSTLGAVLGVRELPGRRLLVNDAGRRQIKVFDSTLTAATVAQDSTAGTTNSYGPRAATIMPYLGDSTVFKEVVSRETVILDRNGQYVRALSLPMFQAPDLPMAFPFPMPHAIDDKGRVLAETGFTVRNGNVADSTLIVRADLESRQVDIVGVRHSTKGKNRMDAPENGNRVVTSIIQPVETEDSWTVLSDGTIAFVRGRDYHVDWILPDGTKTATDKLPFDWKRLTDADKQHLIDSARVVMDSMMAIRNKRNAAPAQVGRGGDAGGGSLPSGGFGRSGGGAAAPGQQGSIQRIEFVPLSEIPDYYPPIRRTSAMADLDGNLWILPTTSAQSKYGELVYDVVNPKKGLFERVRMPLGRSIAGFGKGGIIYLQTGDRTNGFYLERVKLDLASQKK